MRDPSGRGTGAREEGQSGQKRPQEHLRGDAAGTSGTSGGAQRVRESAERTSPELDPHRDPLGLQLTLTSIGK